MCVHCMPAQQQPNGSNDRQHPHSARPATSTQPLPLLHPVHACSLHTPSLPPRRDSPNCASVGKSSLHNCRLPEQCLLNVAHNDRRAACDVYVYICICVCSCALPLLPPSDAHDAALDAVHGRGPGVVGEAVQRPQHHLHPRPVRLLALVGQPRHLHTHAQAGERGGGGGNPLCVAVWLV